MLFDTSREKLQELICMMTLTSMVVLCVITPTTTLAASGFLQPALNFHYQSPEAKMDTTKTTTTTTTTTTTLTVDDTNVSFLFKVKVYPFRRKLFAAVTANNEEEMMKATARFGGPETGVVKRPTTSGNNNNNGVVAFGVDLGLPGSLGGMGYGHQVPFSFPFEMLSISSVQVRTESHLANDISDDHAEY